MNHRAKQRSAPTVPAATAARRGVAWFAVFGLLFQLFLVSSHIHVDEDGWVGLPLSLGLAPLPAHRHDTAFHGHEDGRQPAGAVAGHAVPANGNERVKHPDCQVCQSSPVVSASFVAVTIEFAPATAGTAARPRVAEIDAKRIEPRTHAQPRAPPIQA